MTGQQQQDLMTEQVPMINSTPRRDWDLREPIEHATDDKMDYKLICLNDSNYAGWKYQIKQVLQSKNLWDYVIDPTRFNEPRARQATILLTSSLSYDNLLKVINCEHAHEVWDALLTRKHT